MNAADKIEQIPTDRLIPYARNSRTHSADQIAKVAASIREFGFTNPVLIRDDNTIIAGHGRVLAAQSLGITAIPCIRLGYLTEAQARAYVIADNRLALDAGWDEDMLTSELQALQAEHFDLDLTGFSTPELDELLATDVEPAPDADADHGVAPRADPVTRLGDVWLLGDHRLMCGDSTNAAQAATLMGGGMADLLLTDPPYNVAYVGKTQDALTIQNDSMSDTKFAEFLRGFYRVADACMRPGAVFYVWHADSEGLNFRAAAREVGWRVRQCLVWNKNVFVLGRQDFQWKHEPCLYGWKDGAAHYWYGSRNQTTVIDYARPSRSEDHPTMKPVGLFRYLIQCSTRRGDVALDLFGGSSTTLIACEESGRVARVMELDPVYVDVGVRRWQKLTGRQAILASTGAPFPEDEEVPA